VAYSDYPDAARALPRIGDASRIDMERVLALAPDLAVAWAGGNAPADLERLERLGIPVYALEARQLERIGAQLLDLGVLSGHEDIARQAAGAYLSGLAALRERYADRPPLTVFYQISAQPLMTVSRAHPISAVLAACGGMNVIALDAPPAPAVSIEAVLALNPDVILAGVFPGEGDDPFAAWRRWPQLTAVREQHLYRVGVDSLVRATPRILDGMRDVCGFLAAARGS
jgi:iron complex transport system substrate-binding protein